MTKRADLGLRKRCFVQIKLVNFAENNQSFQTQSSTFCHFCTVRTNFSDFQQSAQVCTKQRFQPEMSTFCHFRTGRTTFKPFSAKCERLYETCFSARDQHVFSFQALGTPLLAVFSKVDDFVQNRSFQPEISKSCHFARGAPLFSDFQQSSRVCLKQRFQPEISTFCHFRTECTTFCHLRTGYTTSQRFSAKCTSFYKTAVSSRHQHVLSFSHWAHHFFAIFSKVHKFVQNSVFRLRSTRFVIFAPGASLFSDFQQSTRVCAKQGFQPDNSTFCHFRTGRTTFQRFSAKYTILCKTVFFA